MQIETTMLILLLVPTHLFLLHSKYGGKCLLFAVLLTVNALLTYWGSRWILSSFVFPAPALQLLVHHTLAFCVPSLLPSLASAIPSPEPPFFAALLHASSPVLGIKRKCFPL